MTMSNLTSFLKNRLTANNSTPYMDSQKRKELTSMENQMERIEETLNRMHDTLLEMDPATPEFKALVRDIEELTKLQMELKSQKPERVMKYILGLVPAATTFLLYGWAFWIDNSDYIKPKMCTSMERWTSPWKK